jgi:hypothetical protein
MGFATIDLDSERSAMRCRLVVGVGHRTASIPTTPIRADDRPMIAARCTVSVAQRDPDDGAIFDSTPETRIRGCPYHNAAFEAASALPEVHDIVHEHKLAFIADLIGVCAELGVQDSHELGHQLAVVFEGGLSLATTLNDTAPMVYARSAADDLISAALRAPRD